MSQELLLEGEKKNSRVAGFLSIILHLLLLLLFLPYFFTTKQIDPGQRGIFVQFGVIDAGDLEDLTAADLGEDKATEEQADTESEENKPPPEEASASVDVEEQEPDRPEENVEDVTRDPQSDIVIDDKKEKESAAVKKQREAAEKQAAEEAQKRAEEEAEKKKFEEQKNKFGKLLSGGTGSGTNRGDEGDASDNPDKSALDDIAKGSGKIGGGLTNRGVISEPTISDNSQKTGTVVIKICVDAAGKVISAKFTQRGSNTTDSDLIKVATAGAYKYKFSPADVTEQCGTLRVNFLVQ